MNKEQQHLHDLIEVNRQYGLDLMKRCEANGHSIVPDESEAVCEICGVLLGTYCEKNPEHTCQFIIDDDNYIVCKHCSRRP